MHSISHVFRQYMSQVAGEVVIDHTEQVAVAVLRNNPVRPPR